jgi:hypothetical protein
MWVTLAGNKDSNPCKPGSLLEVIPGYCPDLEMTSLVVRPCPLSTHLGPKQYQVPDFACEGKLIALLKFQAFFFFPSSEHNSRNSSNPRCRAAMTPAICAMISGYLLKARTTSGACFALCTSLSRLVSRRSRDVPSSSDSSGTMVPVFPKQMKLLINGSRNVTEIEPATSFG